MLRVTGCNAPRTVKIKNVEIGNGKPVIIAGPCAVESCSMIIETARFVKSAGASILRGGAYKPRTSPYSFQGLKEEGLKYLKEASDETGLPVVSEVLDTRDVEMACKYIDMIQVGSRNMQNYSLLKEVGISQKPVMLKRGMASTIDEWLNAAEYIAAEGNEKIIFCERGIRTFERYTRNTLDLSCIPVMKEKTMLPVIVDPSHGTGRQELIEPMSLAAIAAGCDGIMIEVHEHPEIALSDGSQSLNFEQFKNLSRKIFIMGKFMEEMI